MSGSMEPLEIFSLVFLLKTKPSPQAVDACSSPLESICRNIGKYPSASAVRVPAFYFSLFKKKLRILIQLGKCN